MKILIDVNLGPAWVETLTARGHEAIHWSTVGDIRAKDHIIADWAREHGYVIFTHDLDFGTLLALTRARGPSVIQIRTQDPLCPRQPALPSPASLTSMVMPWAKEP